MSIGSAVAYAPRLATSGSRIELFVGMAFCVQAMRRRSRSPWSSATTGMRALCHDQMHHQRHGLGEPGGEWTARVRR